MKKRDTIFSLLWLAIGLPLMGLSVAGVLDEFWSGMGSALMVVGACRLVRAYRPGKSESYREKMETFETDERFHFLRAKAWSWAGYLFVIIGGISVIVLKLIGQELLSLAASCAVCLMLVLYWGAYFVLKKKY